MIRTLVYVGCDSCGDAIGTADDMADDARGARANARVHGATRVRREGRFVDLCRQCSRDTGSKPSGGETR